MSTLPLTLQNVIEDSSARLIPWVLRPVPRAAKDVLATGIATIDELLSGGLPVGAITEIVGAPCSGRTTCAYSFASQVIRRGQVCAWIDGSDCFDAVSAAANGADLERLLWVRCGGQATVPVPVAAESRVSAYHGAPIRVPSGGGPHPRNEVRGMPEAINAFLSRPHVGRIKKKIGTPGMSNRSLGLSSSRTEQVATDRLPARRGEHLLKNRVALEPRCATPHHIERPEGHRLSESCSTDVRTERVIPPHRQSLPWQRLDQALRVTDLLMQAGGFGAVVLDLGGIAPEFVNRVPLATWFRFRSAADRARTSILLLTQHPCAQSSAEVVLRTRAAMPPAGTVMTSLPFTVDIVRQRFRPATSNVVPLRKPPQRDDMGQWNAPASWMGGR